ncbi:S8 family serine peptidase [uncultured Clostridium sp.]|uniref:S8 family serine peptidase n=1 Tax=uncultured Clostridium sp. TaxID=59620 RepID=UPI0028E706F5|nr:S8 family serine peptidase [uncultured Clostridium sp.]
MDKLKVAIIDDGVNRELFNFNKNIINYKILDGKIIYDFEQNTKCEISHGTICTYIFYNYASNYELYSIKIIENLESGTEIKNLIIALQWCLENDIQLINMSIGTTNFNDFIYLEKYINKLCESGIIIVAACRNNGAITYPACLHNVIGVRYDNMNILKEGEYIWNSSSCHGIDITTSCNYKFRKLNKHIEIIKCNSFATPFIAAKVCNLMNKGIFSLNEIKKKLRNNSAYEIKNSLYFLEKKYIYMKNNIGMKIEVPNVVIVNKSFFDIKNTLIQLIKKVREDGYYGVALYDRFKRTSIENGIFKIENDDTSVIETISNKVELLYFWIQPDIIFTIVNNKEELYQLKKDNLIDILVCLYGETVEENYESYCENIIKVYTNKEKVNVYNIFKNIKKSLLFNQ